MKNIELNTQAGTRKGSGVIRMEGSLTLDHAEAVASCFREAVTKYGPLHLRVKKVEDIDLGFLQLVESLRRHQQERGQDLEVEFELSVEQQRLLKSTGFGYLIESKTVFLVGGKSRANRKEGAA